MDPKKLGFWEEKKYNNSKKLWFHNNEGEDSKILEAFLG